MILYFIHIFTLSCKQATFLIEKELHVRLSIIEKMRLSIHLLVCKLCCEYKIKAVFLDELFQTKIKKDGYHHIFETVEIEQFKKEMKKKMKEKVPIYLDHKQIKLL